MRLRRRTGVWRSGNDLSTGNKEGGETDAADETSNVLAGSLAGL